MYKERLWDDEGCTQTCMNTWTATIGIVSFSSPCQKLMHCENITYIYIVSCVVCVCLCVKNRTMCHQVTYTIKKGGGPKVGKEHGNQERIDESYVDISNFHRKNQSKMMKEQQQPKSICVCVCRGWGEWASIYKYEQYGTWHL